MILDFVIITNLGALATCFRLNFAVVDCRAANIIGDFNVVSLAIQTLS